MNNTVHSHNNWLARLTSDAGLAVTFFVVGIISRIPFQSQLLYHWDSVNFVMGMEQFDVRLHQPHPPGYLLYVLLGRLVNLIINDANASLVWISIFFSGLTASVVYLLGRRLFDKPTAIISALIALTSPAFWFYSQVALTYILEAFFVTAIALACLQTLRGNWRMAFIAALLMGLAGGIRQTTLVLMLPLWLFSLRRCGWRVIISAGILLGLTVMAWLAPTIILSGGLDAYLKASSSIGGGVLEDFELFGGGQSLFALLGPFVRLAMYLLYSLMLGIAALLYGTIKDLGNAKALWKQWRPDDRVHVMALWLIPNLVLYAPLVRAPGHTFSFMPALVLMTAAAVMTFSHDLAARLSRPVMRSTLTLTGLMLVVNVAFFLAAPPYLLDIKRVVTTTPSWPTIHHRDQYLDERVDYITEHFDAATTIVLTAGPDYRHPDYYLRDYATLNYETELLTSDVPAGAQTLVLFSDTLTSDQDDVQTITLPGGELFYLELDAKSNVIVQESKVSVQQVP